MIKIKGFFTSLKLSHKFTFLIIAIIVFPMVVLSSLFFSNIQKAKISDKLKTIELKISQNHSQMVKNVEMCNMSTQVLLSSKNFWYYAVRFYNGEAFDTHELLKFYQEDIASLERLVNSNPYLFQIRVFVDYKNIPEMMPVLYHKDRMDRLEWSKDGEYQSGSWYFDYDDNIFPAFTSRSKQHLVSLVTEKVDGFDKNNPAVIEIATKMDLLLPDLYTSNSEEWAFFVDRKGSYYYDSDYNSRWFDSIDTLLLKENDTLESNRYKQTMLNGEPVIICHVPLKELNGYMVKVVSLEKDISSVNNLRNIFWGCFFIIVLLLIYFSDTMVKIILKQFYAIMDTIHEVQKGDLEVRVPHCGSDEIGELGQQINKMLGRITHLIDDNIKREILVKDSEIRALQNQINAHFIYNVLESIKMMAEVEEKYEISDAVTSLGKLLRYSMKWVSKNVTVGEEIDYIKNYLALINLRFDYEIYLSLNLPEEIYEQEIPKMSLQPIIENAIYHGIEEMAEDTNIYMKGIIFDNYCTIEITDAGRGMTDTEIIRLQKKLEGEIEEKGSSGNGIGLKNVQDRIKISFGDDYGITIASKKGCYTKVIVKIPMV